MAPSVAVSEEVRLAAHVHHLSSVANPFVKHVVKLRQSSAYRYASGSLVLVGDVPLRELCDIAPAKLGKKAFIEYLFVLETNAGESLAEYAQRVVQVTPSVMHKLSGVQSTQGCKAVGVTCLPSSFCSLETSLDYSSSLLTWCPCSQRLLVLDGIQDPGNLGTLLRTVAAFDWDGVFLLDGCCDPFNEKALRASRGACFWVPIACGQWSQLEALAKMRKMALYAGEAQHRIVGVGPKHDQWGKEGERMGMHASQEVYGLRGSNINEESLCLILGNEGQGLSEESRAACRLVSIPMAGRFESLNVAVAGGILLYLLQKQQHKT